MALVRSPGTGLPTGFCEKRGKLAGGRGGRLGPLAGPGQSPGGGPGGEAPGSSCILLNFMGLECIILVPDLPISMK